MQTHNLGQLEVSAMGLGCMGMRLSRLDENLGALADELHELSAAKIDVHGARGSGHEKLV